MDRGPMDKEFGLSDQAEQPTDKELDLTDQAELPINVATNLANADLNITDDTITNAEEAVVESGAGQSVDVPVRQVQQPSRDVGLSVNGPPWPSLPPPPESSEVSRSHPQNAPRRLRVQNHTNQNEIMGAKFESCKLDEGCSQLVVDLDNVLTMESGEENNANQSPYYESKAKVPIQEGAACSKLASRRNAPTLNDERQITACIAKCQRDLSNKEVEYQENVRLCLSLVQNNDVLRRENEILHNHNEVLQSHKRDDEQQIARLKQDNDVLRRENEILHNRNEVLQSHKRDDEQLIARLKQTSQEIRELKEGVEGCQENGKDLKAQMEQLKQKLIPMARVRPYRNQSVEEPFDQDDEEFLDLT